MHDLQVLLVEDSEGEAELVVSLLEDAAAGVRVEHCSTLREAVARAAESEFDAALVDLSLPDAYELEAVRALRRAQPELPLVVLTGFDDESTALSALAAGAQDYVGKGDMSAPVLLRALRYARERALADAAVRNSSRWSAALLDGLEAPTCAVDVSGHVVAVNAAMRAGFLLPLSGAPGTELSVPWTASASVREPNELLAGVHAVLAGSLPRFEHQCQGPDERWWSVRTAPLPAGGGAVVTQVDITALKRAQQQLAVAALHDPLTGLANRTLLRDRLEQAFGYAAREHGSVAVVYLDLDRFKLVNDTFGHTAGDGVLVTVAERLRRAGRRSDTVARVSGDEYVVAWVADDEVQARSFARSLVDAVNGPTVVDGREVQVFVSAGLAVAGRADTVDDVVGAAGEAMYAAKARGGARLEVASAEMRDRLLRRLEVEAVLEAALAEHRLEVHYQPVVALADGRASGVEALVRLRLPDGRLVPPGEFIDVAERSGLVVPLGRQVLDVACHEAAGWIGDAAGLSVAVNLSTRQLAQPDVVATVHESLSSSGLDPSRLVLEVTESAVVEDAEAALRALTALKALGVRTAIDDFGTGYSSFLYLKQFPVDILKIDRAFVNGMLDSADDAAIVASIVRLGRDVGLDLIAEGVETEEQRRQLLELGCGEAQGYLFSRPVPADELARALVPTVAPAGADVCEDGELSPGQPPVVDPAVIARIEQLHSGGASLHTIAAVLNAEALTNPSGRRWHARAVARHLNQVSASAT